MLTWNYRVFREKDGDYVIRSVTYDENGEIVGCTQDEVAPVGRSIEELVQDIKSFQEALELPVLTVDEVPSNSKRKRTSDRSTNLTVDQVRAELGLDKKVKSHRQSQRKTSARWTEAETQGKTGRTHQPMIRHPKAKR